jgi:hypothetical protein
MDVFKISDFVREVSRTFQRVGVYLSPEHVVKNTHEKGVLFPDINNVFKLIPEELDVIIFSNIFTDDEYQSIISELNESGVSVMSLNFASRNNDGAETVKRCAEMFEKCMKDNEVLESDIKTEDRCTTFTFLIVSC